MGNNLRGLNKIDTLVGFKISGRSIFLHNLYRKSLFLVLTLHKKKNWYSTKIKPSTVLLSYLTAIFLHETKSGGAIQLLSPCNSKGLCRCRSVILLHPKMGVALHKHDIISMPIQQCTNTKHISIERYHPVVSIMLRYLYQIKIFGENLGCRAVKIDKNFGGDLPYFALKCNNLP